jgi:UDP-glucuronate 4-epimerase
VVGLDNLNDYYDVGLKHARLGLLKGYRAFRFVEADIAEAELIRGLFDDEPFPRVVHLAAQAGVRYSLVNPHVYAQSNVLGFLNVLEGCRAARTEHLVFASSSSVYGNHTSMPFSVHDCAGHPVSLYAATKRANELMAHSYAHLFGLAATGLRFFTVYGPWGRPDMALFLFTRSILEGKPIEVFNHGDMERDFTYVDDIVEGIVRVLERPAQPDPEWQSDAPDPASSSAPFRVFNIGSHRPARIDRLIEVLETALGRKAICELRPIQPGDVPATFADIADLQRETGFQPRTSLEEGVPKFVAWYREFYGV